MSTYALWYTVWRHFVASHEVSLHATLEEAAESAAGMRDWEDCAVDIHGVEELGVGMVDSDRLDALIEEAEEAEHQRWKRRMAEAQANPIPRWHPQVLTPAGEWVDLPSHTSRSDAYGALAKFAKLPEDRKRVVEPKT